MSEKKTRRGFSGMPKERQDEIRAKSLETRQKNKLLKEQTFELAKEKRLKAEEFIKQAEILNREADELDGQCSSTKHKRKRDAELTNAIIDQYKDSVSPQYLKTMIRHAILRGLSVDELVTPTHAAMDILHDPDASAKEKESAMKTLQQFENAKPAAKQEEEGEGIGSAQDEFNKLMTKVDMIAPKR